MSTPVVTSNSLESDGKYEAFLRGVQLISVGLKKCAASIDRERFIDLYSKEKRRPLRTLKDGFRVTMLGANFFEAAGAFSVKLRGSLKDEPVVMVECEFEAHLHAVEPIAKEFVERFVKSEFPLVLVPYARQFISSVTATMSIPPVVIPLSTRPAKSPEEKIGTKRLKAHGKTK